MKKKVLSVLLCVAMAATLAVGCGSKDEGTTDGGSDAKTEDTAKDDSSDSGK